MLPNNGSMTRPPPSLLPGSDGTRSPVFKRYYEAATTTGLVWWHSVCHVAPPYLGLISCIRSTPRGNRRSVAGVLFSRCHPLPAFHPEDALGSPKFPGNPSVPLPCSQTPAEPRCLASLRHLGVAPRMTTRKASAILDLSELNHTASALTVYASCRHYGRRRKTRFRWGPALPGGIRSTH